MTPEKLQKEVCKRFGSPFVEALDSDKLGVAIATLGRVPIHGLRQNAENGTCGWYVWAGDDLSDHPEFFQPLHVSHLETRCPEILPYLGLAPGWRFLIAPDHEDVWFDPTLLEPPA